MIPGVVVCTPTTSAQHIGVVGIGNIDNQVPLIVAILIANNFIASWVSLTPRLGESLHDHRMILF